MSKNKLKVFCKQFVDKIQINLFAEFQKFRDKRFCFSFDINSRNPKVYAENGLQICYQLKEIYNYMISPIFKTKKM